MNTKDFKSKDYKRLFKISGLVTGLHSEGFLMAFNLGGPFCLYHGGAWYTFINIKKEKLCLEKGLSIFGDEKKYRKYSEEFRALIKRVKTDFIPRYSTNTGTVNEDDMREVIKEAILFQDYYAQTEFSFHDLAYERMKEEGDDVLKRNLEDLGHLKFEGREILNAYMHDNGVYQNALTIVSKEFLEDDDAFYLFSSELLDLYQGVIPDKKIIDGRKKVYSASTKNNELLVFSQNEAETLATEFIHKTNDSSVKGIIANKGKATGKAIIAPMLTDMNIVKEIVGRMKKGDVLVAESTTPELMSLCKLASAIVTNQGGMLSHAAVVSREFNIPCVIGTQTATEAFKDGDMLEVDANKGIVRKIT